VTIKEHPRPRNRLPAAQGIQGGGGVGFTGPNQQRQLTMIQHLLNADDAAWQKISPKVEKVLAPSRR
jgi:hypothetical protein